MMMMIVTMQKKVKLMMSQMVMMVFNRKKLDVCVYLMSAVAVQMEVKHQDQYDLKSSISWIWCRWRRVPMQQ